MPDHKVIKDLLDEDYLIDLYRKGASGTDLDSEGLELSLELGSKYIDRHLTLIGFYRSCVGPQMYLANKHIKWLAENYPEINISPMNDINRDQFPSWFYEVSDIYISACQRNPANKQLFDSAFDFVSMQDLDLATSFVETVKSARGRWDPQLEAARLQLLEIRSTLSKNPTEGEWIERLDRRIRQAKTQSDELLARCGKARYLSLIGQHREALVVIDNPPQSAGISEALLSHVHHVVSIVGGIVNYLSGDVEKAVYQLKQSTEVRVRPQVEVLGVDFRLANMFLHDRMAEPVTEFVESLRPFLSVRVVDELHRRVTSRIDLP